MQKSKGMLFTILSAFIFGFAPIVLRRTFDGGSNAMTGVFLRNAFAVPILAVALKTKGLSLRMAPAYGKGLLLLGANTVATSLLLTGSYRFIPVGMAGVLHFIYPLLVAVGCAVLFKERMNVWQLSALLCAMAGIAAFLERGGSAALPGVVFALLSGVTYAVYILALDRTGLKNLYYLTLTFYLSVINAVLAGAVALVSGQLTFRLTPEAWLLSLLYAVLTSVLAITLFQVGVRYIGASTAAILSTFEPITTLVMGALLLGEEMNAKKILGCLLIVASAFLIAAGAKKEPTPPQQEDMQP